MTKTRERLIEIEQRKAELRTELGKPETTTERMEAIKTEAESLSGEEKQLRTKLDLSEQLLPGKVPESRCARKNSREQRADKFRDTGHLTIPLFSEGRSLLISSGKLATPTAVYDQIGELPSAVCSIVDDVDTIDGTGTGTWKFPYKVSDAVAAKHTEGAKHGGTGAAYDHVAVSPSEWSVLDEISKQVKKQTNLNYAASVQNSGYLALRRYARDEITAAVLASPLLEKRSGVSIGPDYLRDVVLGFGGDESVGGGTKLYLCKEDLIALGRVRGTNEKKALYTIAFTDENNGTISEGGLSVPFSINPKLAAGQQLYGQPKSIKMVLWGDYEINTDESGHYFDRGMIGILAAAEGGVTLAVHHGMQLIRQATE